MTPKIKKIIVREGFVLLLLLSMSADCFAFNIPESIIRGSRPESLKKHKTGPAFPLSEKDIQEAIEFGKADKHKQDVIRYAFMFDKDSSVLLDVNPRRIYVLICTNYYLIADYAAQQARNYENIDMDYVNFLAGLPTFKVEVVEKIGDVFFPFLLNSKFVLLKNGNKLENSEDNPKYKSRSPYANSHFSGQLQWQEKANEAFRQNIEMANQMAEQYGTTKIDVNNIPAMDYGVNKNIYNYKDINLNSKYEIVVIYSNKEKRIPIDFSGIK